MVRTHKGRTDCGRTENEGPRTKDDGYTQSKNALDPGSTPLDMARGALSDCRRAKQDPAYES